MLAVQSDLDQKRWRVSTQAQKDEARRLVAEADAKLQKLVAEILTDEQKTLVEKVNAAAREVREQVSESTQSEFTAAKGNDERTEQLRQRMSQRVRDTSRSAFRSGPWTALNAR